MQKSFSEIPQQKFPFSADVADKAQVLAFAEAVKHFRQRIGAGKQCRAYSLGQIHTEDLAFWATNAHQFVQCLLPLARTPARAAKQYRWKTTYFNICSTASLVAYPNGGSYCISKFALLVFQSIAGRNAAPTK